MTDGRTEIIAELEDNLKNFISFFGSLSDEQLRVQVYTDGAKWTVKQVLAHFITIERSMHWLFKNMLSGGSGSPDDFDVDRFNLTQPLKLDGLIVEELIEQFKSVRENTIAIVRGMTEQDLNRAGRHPFHLGAYHRIFQDATVLGKTTDLVVRHATVPVPIIPTFQ